MSELKTTLVAESDIELYDEESGSFIFNAKGKYYIQLATGDYLFFNTRDRQKCVDYVKEHFDGKYTLRTAKQSAGSGSYTAGGTTSRRGTASHLKKTV